LDDRRIRPTIEAGMSSSKKDPFPSNPFNDPPQVLEDEDIMTVVDDRPRQPSPPALTPMRPPSGRGKILLAGAAGIAAIAGLAGFCWKTHKARGAAETELATLRDQNRALSDALELHRASSVDLGGKLESCTEELEEGKATLKSTDARVVALEEKLSDTKGAVAESRQQLKEFEAVTRQFQRMIDSGQLEVIFRRGQMIVKLPARVLFASGSAEVSEGGQKALAEVAKILRKMRQRRFTVAGHTDNVPISKPFKNNWELSAARAVSVVEVLTGRGMRAASLAAAGYGPYAPIATNRTAAGRQINRRIEIILEPELRPLPKQLRQKTAKKTAKKPAAKKPQAKK
jgi:chemotaxis protein MotB